MKILVCFYPIYKLFVFQARTLQPPSLGLTTAQRSFLPPLHQTVKIDSSKFDTHEVSFQSPLPLNISNVGLVQTIQPQNQLIAQTTQPQVQPRIAVISSLFPVELVHIEQLPVPHQHDRVKPTRGVGAWVALARPSTHLAAPYIASTITISDDETNGNSTNHAVPHFLEIPSKSALRRRSNANACGVVVGIGNSGGAVSGTVTSSLGVSSTEVCI